MTWLLVAVAAVGAAGLGYLYYARRQVGGPGPAFYCRCPACQRKLHYHAERAGKKARCPVCKKPFVYPEMPSVEQ